MPSSVWKLSALLGVIAIGCLVVMQAQQGLSKTAAATGDANSQFLEIEGGAGTPADPGKSEIPSEPTVALEGFEALITDQASTRPPAQDERAAPAAENESSLTGAAVHVGSTTAQILYGPEESPLPDQSEPTAEDEANPFATSSAPSLEGEQAGSDEQAGDATQEIAQLFLAAPQKTDSAPPAKANRHQPFESAGEAGALPQQNEPAPSAVSPQTTAGQASLTPLPSGHPGPVLMPTPVTDAALGQARAATTADVPTSLPASSGEEAWAEGETAQGVVPAAGRSALAPYDVVIPFAPGEGRTDPAEYAAVPPRAAPRNAPQPFTSSIPSRTENAATPPPEAAFDPFRSAPAPARAPALDAEPARHLQTTSIPAANGEGSFPLRPLERAELKQAPGAIPIPSVEPNPFAASPAEEGASVPVNGGPGMSPPAMPNQNSELNPFEAKAAPQVDDRPRDDRPRHVPEPAEDYLTGDGVITDDAPAGPQQPELRIEKQAPNQAVINEPLDYVIRVRNVGRTAARHVEVEDRIPRGTMLHGTIPQAEQDERTKTLTWRLGTIEPGGEAVIKIRVIPQQPGPIGSVATVRFVAEVSASTVVTAPELSLKLVGPTETVVDEKALYKFVITNSGSGDAHGVFIRNLLPEGLTHEGGNDLEYEVGDLKAGDTREIELALTAVQPGEFSNRAMVTINGETKAETAAGVRIIDSRLTIRRTGPARRFVGRPAAYSNVVTNQSAQPLQNITVIETLPRGVELAGLPQGGQFDPTLSQITWKIARLEAGGSTELLTNVVAGQAGELRGKVEAVDGKGNRVEAISQLDVAGFSSLAVDVAQQGQPAPVAIGEQVSLRMTVKNRGSEAAHNVETVFEIPAELEFVTAEGPVEFTQEGRQVRFAAIDTLPEGSEQEFDIILTAAEESRDARVKVRLNSDQQSDLGDEESVIIFADR